MTANYSEKLNSAIPDTWISLHSLFQRYQVAYVATKFLDVDLVIELKNQPVLPPKILLVLEVVSVVYVIPFLNSSIVLFECLTGMRFLLLFGRNEIFKVKRKILPSSG